MLFKKIIFLLCKKYIEMRWKLLGKYYEGLMVQARFLYRQSELFKLRWREMGLEFAEKTFDSTNDYTYFFHKAKKEPLLIRWQILLDALSKKEPRPYYIKEER